MEDVRRVSLSYKRRTTVMYGQHPRHFGILSDAALEVWAQFLVLTEAAGNAPMQLQELPFAL